MKKYIKVSKVVRLIGSESTIELWGREVGSCIIMGIEFLFCKLKAFWRSLLNNANIINITELYILK